MGSVVLPLWVVENRISPLLWPLAYTTACTAVQAVMCWADELFFVSVGNRFATKQLHVSVNLTCKYELAIIIVSWLRWRRTAFFTIPRAYKYHKLWGTFPLMSPTSVIGRHVPLPPPYPESPPMLNDRSFHSFCCIMSRKGKSLKSAFLSE